MSDFGANIFDDQPAPARREAPGRDEVANEPPQRERRRGRTRGAKRDVEAVEATVEPAVEIAAEARDEPQPAAPAPTATELNPWHGQETRDADDEQPAQREERPRRDERGDRGDRGERREEHRPHRDEQRARRDEHRSPRDEHRSHRQEHRERRDEHRHRREEHRDDRREHRERRDHREPRPHHTGPRPAPAMQQPAPAARPAAPATDKVVLLLDLDALRTGAKTRGVELAWNRLQRGLARGRGVAGATAFASESRKVPAGFTLLTAGGDFAAGVELAAAAFAGASGGAAVLLAPVTPVLTVLARALTSRGVKVELADFEASQCDGLPVQALGKDCLFVP